MLSKGIYIRKVNHYILNGPYTGKVVLDVKQRKWKLPHCDIYYNINCFPVQNFAERKKKKEGVSSFIFTRQRARFTFRLFLPLQCLTSVFGMGTGISTALSSPDSSGLFPEN